MKIRLAVCNNRMKNKNWPSPVGKKIHIKWQDDSLCADFKRLKLAHHFHSDTSEAGLGIMNIDGLRRRATGGPAKIEKLPGALLGISEGFRKSLGEK